VEIINYRVARKDRHRRNHKYRVVSKDGHRGAIINIVAQQKMSIAVQSKISWRIKGWALCVQSKIS